MDLRRSVGIAEVDLNLTRTCLFSLTNRDNQPSKMWQIDTNHSIFCYSEYGPIFGSHDIHICNDSNTKEDCYSNFSYSYHHPVPSQGVSYLPGSRQFKLSEIEVYEIL